METCRIVVDSGTEEHVRLNIGTEHAAAGYPPHFSDRTVRLLTTADAHIAAGRELFAPFTNEDAEPTAPDRATTAELAAELFGRGGAR